MAFDNALVRESMRRSMKSAALLAVLPFVATASDASAQEPQIKLGTAFAFPDRFPEGTTKLGFVEGVSVSVGTPIRFDESQGDPIEIVHAIASNGTAEFALESLGLGFVQGWQALPAPMFGPEKHLGVWMVTVEDANGRYRPPRCPGGQGFAGPIRR